MIKVENLTKKYDDSLVFQNLTAQLGDGEGLLVTGRSGCGKTTLLRILAGFDSDYSGEVWIDGRRMDEKVPPRMRDIAIVFQEPTLWEYMTVRRNLSYGMKPKEEERLREVAEALGIGEILDRYPNEISGGQAKRASFARALLAGKKHILLDEPLANVDEGTKELILEYMCGGCWKGHSILYVTHDREEMDRLGYRELRL